MRILTGAVDAPGVKRTRPANDPVHLVPFGEEKLSEVGSVLPANAGNESFCHVLCDSFAGRCGAGNLCILVLVSGVVIEKPLLLAYFAEKV